MSITRFIRLDFLHNKRSLSDARSKSFSFASVATATQIILATLPLYSQNATWRLSTANTASDNVFQPSKLPFYICHVRRGIFEKYLSFRLNYTPTRREGAILQSPCPSVRPFTLSLKMSQLLLEEMILYLIYGFVMVTCTCLPFPGLPHIYFLFTVRLRIFHVCRNKNFCNTYLSFYWKK